MINFNNIENKYMITPDYNDAVWIKEPDAKYWAITYGSHHIYLENDSYYNHYDEKPNFIAKKSKAIYFEQDIVERLKSHIIIPNEIKKGTYEENCFILKEIAKKIQKRRYL